MVSLGDAKCGNDMANHWRIQFSLAHLLGAVALLGMLMWIANEWLRRGRLNAPEALLLTLIAVSAAIGTLVGGGKGFLVGAIIGLALYVLLIPFVAILFPTT
jgi:hypothetical protein